MKKKLLWFLMFFFGMASLFYLQFPGRYPLEKIANAEEPEGVGEIELRPVDYTAILQDSLNLLKQRKDKAALAIAEKILLAQPANPDALWIKAEVARRSRDYQLAEAWLNKIIEENPNHLSALISLAYIRYKDDRLNEARELAKQVFRLAYPDKEKLALANLMFGMINSRRVCRGGFYSKIRYGARIKVYFLRAEELAPELPEVHLGLGTFYLLAPAIVGGSLAKAGDELELALKLAPDFATVNARLAQLYKKRGDEKNYEFYFLRAKTLDPQNEALKEIAK